jgi:hypothetical protein
VVLREWARANDAIRSMRYRFTQTEYDRVFEKREVRKGEVQLCKPDLLRVDLDTSRQPTIVLFTSDQIHFFNPTGKTEWVYPKPADSSFLGENTPERSFRDLLTGVAFQEAFQQWVYWAFAGLPVRDLPRRFDLRLTREDAWHGYLDIRDGSMRKVGFKRMRVVLCKDCFRVRQIWYEHPNVNETTIDFEKPDTSAKITSKSIQEGLPQGWKRVHFPVPARAFPPRRASPEP